MKTFFILGRNPELSRAEVLEFLKARDRTFSEVSFDDNILIIETNEGEKFDVQEFGGVMWIGSVDFEGDNNGFKNYIEKNEIIPDDKFSYGVFGNLDIDVIKEKFKSRRKKAVQKHGSKQIEFQNGNKTGIPKADYYLLYTEVNDLIYFGRVFQEYDNYNVKKRDMEKPVRRESLAISPRLSKILVNLSGAKPRDLMIDPFCGVGGILQEALLKRINVYGADKDKQATIDAIKNLKWVEDKFNFKSKYTVENIDSRKAPDLQFAAVATETPLGKVLRKKPNSNEARQIIENFEAYMIPILQRIKKVKKPKAHISITFPVINGLHVNVEKISDKTGLRVYMNPILESRDDQFISRDIVVFS